MILKFKQRILAKHNGQKMSESIDAQTDEEKDRYIGSWTNGRKVENYITLNILCMPMVF